MAKDDRTKLFVQVHGDQHLNSICSALRGLFYASGQGNGQAAKNQQFRKGVEIQFGAAPSIDSFLEMVETVFRRRVRKRMTFERRG